MRKESHLVMRMWGVSLAALSLSAQTLSAPVAAVIWDDQRGLLSVHGVYGSLLPGVALPLADPIVSAAFAGSGALKTAAEVAAIDQNGTIQFRRTAPAGPALFGFGADGKPEWVYFPLASRLESWDGTKALDTRSWGDAVVALGPVGAGTLDILTSQGAQLWAETIATESGAIVKQIPVTGSEPAVSFESGWLVKGAYGLLWIAAGQSIAAREIAVPVGARSLQTAGPHAVAINGRWLLSANPQGWPVLEIPVTSRLPPRLNVPPPRRAGR